MKSIKIGTRGSALALRQAEIAAEKISQYAPEMKIELVAIQTKGDKILDKTLEQIGGKGVFVKEIEQALLNGNIDIAVHSMKDMPAELPKNLCFGCVLEREDPRDCLVTREGYSFWELPAGAKIGTGSARRKQQLEFLRQDIMVVPIRGNITTRMNKMKEELDGVVLAAAGLHRLSMQEQIVQYFTINQILPAACQGILALEIRKEDTEIKGLCEKLNHKSSYVCAVAERSFLAAVGADCHAPVAAYARLENGYIELTGYYQGERRRQKGRKEDAQQLGFLLKQAYTGGEK